MSVDLNIKILLVEDAGVMRKMERKTLNQLGFENIIEAKDGDDAIVRLQEGSNIDLIISDWNMPNRNGYEFLIWVRANENFSNLPFLMATGRGEKKEVEKASEAGVSSFISKPFNAEELREKIEEAFGISIQEKDIIDKRRQPRITDSGKVLLNVGHIQITDHLVLGVLKHLIKVEKLIPKYFKFETQCMPSWNPIAKALERSTIDAACVLAPIAMDLFNFGVPIKLILFAHKGGSIFVRNRKGGEFKEPYQNFFKGKTFYIPHSMSVHNMLAHMFFSGIGIRPGVTGETAVDVNLEVVPPIKMPEILSTNSDACGYLVAEPLGTKAIAAGIAELQFLSSELWENHPCCIVAMQNDIIENYPDAVYEFTQMLVQAGKFMKQKPGTAAEIAVNFLDPDKSLGLKVPLLKNVLTEPMGIKTDDLYPVKEDLDRIQKYMHDRMGIGNLIDIDEFVDLRFANKACTDRVSSTRYSVLHDTEEKALEILGRRVGIEKEQTTKALINKEGKYLTFSLDNQQFGIDILKIREIIRMIPIRSVPQSPPFVKGIINPRGHLIPVIDLRIVFEMKEVEYDKKSCIIILEIESKGLTVQMGVTVDSVSEVTNILAENIEATPSFGVSFNTDYILGMSKSDDKVMILLDIDRVLSQREVKIVEKIYDE